MGYGLLVALVAAGVLGAGLGQTALAQTRAVTAEQYDVDITVENDGTLVIRERLTLAFTGGPFQHGFQTIALARVEAIRDVRVSEPGRPYAPGTERPYTFATSTRNNALRIDWWFPPTRDAQRTFEISYRAEGALRIYPEGDQLYWQAIDAERQVQAQLEEARQQSRQLVAEAQAVAKRIEDEARARAQAEVEQMRARALADIQLERDAAIAALRREFADITVAAAEKVINRSLDRTAHRQLIEQVLAEAGLADGARG